MKFSKSIVIFLFASSILRAFSYALNRTYGNVLKSLLFVLYFLAIKLGLIGTLTFLGLFFYFYRNSGKFRKSITSALLAIFVLFSGSLESQAKDADAFTPHIERSVSNQLDSQTKNIAKTLRGGFKPDKKIVYRIKEDSGLVRAAKEACKNEDVQKDINHLEEELAKGNDNPGIGRKPICKGVIEHRGANGGVTEPLI